MTERDPLPTDVRIDPYSIFRIYRKLWGRFTPFHIHETFYTENLIDKLQKAGN